MNLEIAILKKININSILIFLDNNLICCNFYPILWRNNELTFDSAEEMLKLAFIRIRMLLLDLSAI